MRLVVVWWQNSVYFARFHRKAFVFVSLVQGKSEVAVSSFSSEVSAQSSARPSPRIRSPTENERFMVKEESAASIGTRLWTPEGRSLTLSIAFML
ncbi:hypothetical protein AVEN_26226-1 [Araneus ventricosus]|uniref:Uncharacterized protein n=1 Tax=Araneus ventricosus TaxID=182803 RepID=A0A4Y2AMP9_ARAVE|nr:hypothetical protein AVEN_26226-1 [Araneus ventricosus]